MPRSGRPKAVLVLTDEEREQLADRGVVSLRRGRIVVRSAQELSNLADSDMLSTPTGGSATR